jgi:photosystem II stability/assembly factor-like uncharacterized protein
MNPRDLLLLLLFLLTGCSGSGAVNPLTPRKAGEGDAADAKAAEAVYWATAPISGTLSETLYDVTLLGATEGWACGARSAVLKWDGRAWTKVQTGITLQQDLYAIAFSDSTEGWAVGERGLLLHYNQGKWVQEESPTGENLFDLALQPSKSGWAVGENGILLSLSGGKWTPVTVAGFTQALYAVGMSSAGNAWAVGDRGSILRYEGADWTEYPASPTSEKLRGLHVESDAEAWASGGFGTLLRFNGSSWTRMNSPTSGVDLYDIRIRGGEEGWACGQDGTILYYDGSRWIQHKPVPGRPALNGVALLDDKTAFLAGQNGTLLKFQPGGELSRGSLSLEGKAEPVKEGWLLTYALSNAGAQAVPLVVFHLRVPKGFKPSLPSGYAAPVPTPAESSMSATPPVEASGNTALPALRTPSPASGPKAVASVTPTAVPTPPWKMKKDLEWDLGNIAGSASRTVTLVLRSDPGKPPAAAVVEAYLKSKDEVLAEADALSLGGAKGTPVPKRRPTPGASPAATPTAGSVASAASASLPPKEAANPQVSSPTPTTNAPADGPLPPKQK